jgi:hypothetical protein
LGSVIIKSSQKEPRIMIKKMTKKKMEPFDALLRDIGRGKMTGGKARQLEKAAAEKGMTVHQMLNAQIKKQAIEVVRIASLSIDEFEKERREKKRRKA